MTSESKGMQSVHAARQDAGLQAAMEQVKKAQEQLAALIDKQRFNGELTSDEGKEKQ